MSIIHSCYYLVQAGSLWKRTCPITYKGTCIVFIHSISSKNIQIRKKKLMQTRIYVYFPLPIINLAPLLPVLFPNGNLSQLAYVTSWKFVFESIYIWNWLRFEELKDKHTISGKSLLWKLNALMDCWVFAVWLLRISLDWMRITALFVIYITRMGKNFAFKCWRQTLPNCFHYNEMRCSYYVLKYIFSKSCNIYLLNTIKKTMHYSDYTFDLL